MDRRFFFGLGLVAALGATAALQQTAFAVGAVAEPGAMAPDFTAMGADGKSYKLSDFRGKAVVLEWTNHDCPFVRKHYETGNMQALQKEATGAGVVWLTMSSSAPGDQGHVTPASAQDLTVKRNAAPSAFLLDPKGEIGRTYNAKVTPHMYIVDKTGKLAYAGGIDDKPTANKADVPTARNYVREALAALAAGKAPEMPTTRAYGCTIKYTS